MIIPSRGPARRLGFLLESLAEQSVGFEVIVVDNASPGFEVSELCDSYEFARAIRLERNAGFSMPVNLGARAASGDALVLLNDDCVCEPQFVEQIVAALDPAAGVVMAAGVMRDARRLDLIDSAGMEFDSTLLVYDYLNGERIDVLGRGVADPIGPSAAAAAFDRNAFLGQGGFDERLFAYWEDVDLVLRLLRAGGRCKLAPLALGAHRHSATLGSGSYAKNYLMGYGRSFVLRKWGVVTPRRIAPVLARELVIVGGQAAIDHNLAGLRGRVRGWLSSTPTEPYPQAAASSGGGSPFALNLVRRLQRRRRLLRRR